MGKRIRIELDLPWPEEFDPAIDALLDTQAVSNKTMSEVVAHLAAYNAAANPIVIYMTDWEIYDETDKNSAQGLKK